MTVDELWNQLIVNLNKSTNTVLQLRTDKQSASLNEVRQLKNFVGLAWTAVVELENRATSPGKDEICQRSLNAS